MYRIAIVQLVFMLKHFFITVTYVTEMITNTMFLSYLVPVQVRGDASIGDTHAEARYASKLICRGQSKGIRLTLVASQTRCVLLKEETSENKCF